MVTEVSLEQRANAYFPIEMTELGMATDDNISQSAKALSPIEVMVLGMMVLLQPVIKVFVAVSMMALQLLRESYLEFPLSTFML